MMLWTAHRFAGEDEWATFLVEAKEDPRDVVGSGCFRQRPRRRLVLRGFGTCLSTRCATDSEEWEWEAEA